MRRLYLCIVLLAAFATAGTLQHPAAQGQDTKKGKTSAVIEIAEGKDGKYRFFVRDGEGKLLAMSSPGGFATEKEARAGVDVLKEAISKAKVTVMKGDKDEKKGAKDKK
jgi:hypothetical protein